MFGLQISRKQILILAVITILTVLLFVALKKTQPEFKQNDGELENDTLEIVEIRNEKPISLVVDMLTQIDRQAEIDEILLAELNSGTYRFDNPLVVVDPYGMSPLTALVLFTSDEPLNVSVHVQGKTELADVDFTFDVYNTSHQIPVYGLYPGELNEVVLTAFTQNGSVREKSMKVQTEPLPLWLEKNIIITDLVQAENYQPGFNFTFDQKTAFDVNGEYRWYYNYSQLLQATIYGYNGNILLAEGSYHEGNLLIYEVNMLGKILRVYYSPYGVHHDIAAINGGNLLVTGSHGDTDEDFIYEIDVMTGKIVNTLDLKRVLQRTRTSNSPEYSTENWFHNNSITYNNEGIIISGRDQSAVVKLSWPEGVIDWVLSNHVGWNLMFQKYLLTPTGTNFEWCYCQHAVMILPDFDNDSDTIDILLFDNGDVRYANDMELQRMLAASEVGMMENYSRMVQYRINEKDKTIEQIWQFGSELGEAYYSAWRGDANLLDNGNFFGTFDRHFSQYGGSFNTNIIEVDSCCEIVWEAYATSIDSIGAYTAYRCERLPLYTFAANDLQIGVTALNLIPEVMLP